VFSSDTLQWHSFWDCFEAAVDHNTSNTGVQKCNYLQAQLQGSSLSVITTKYDIRRNLARSHDVNQWTLSELQSNILHILKTGTDHINNPTSPLQPSWLVQTGDQHRSFQNLRNDSLVLIVVTHIHPTIANLYKNEWTSSSGISCAWATTSKSRYRCCHCNCRYHTSLCNNAMQTNSFTVPAPTNSTTQGTNTVTQVNQAAPNIASMTTLRPSQSRIQHAYWKSSCHNQSQNLKQMFYLMRGLKDPFFLKS